MTSRTPEEVIAQYMAGRGEIIGDEIAATAVEELAAAGYVIVPKEPTEVMLTRGHALGVSDRGPNDENGIWGEIQQPFALRLRTIYLPAAYRAMISAKEKPAKD